ncbi:MULTISPECIES: hypothetical protein [Planococcus]|uniref:Lipoprotein n=2 Tax=Planococcus TaxID=1372 RepID=A0ABM5WYY3_9BACL|nr:MULTISPECIES: hypothetical protein [Planococcus]ALS79548.1 hypothetical protein AUO94_13340 [Planococcus kocurii]MDJ0331550.1 hypothetical protein [Planococcus sp. S3-L1]
MKRTFLFFMSIVMLSGCSIPRGCPPNTIVEWVDLVKINDIQYHALDATNYTVEEKDLGEIIGEVKYEMADQACLNHQIKNGDAAFLSVGTTLYEFNGYKSDFRIIADGIVYEVQENDKAKTIGELYDIEGKVEGMSVRSSYDGSHVMDLKEEHWTKFINEFLTLDFVGFDNVYKKIEDEEGTFLDIHLKDGSSVRILYWTDANVLNLGAVGNDTLKNIISLYK